MPPCTSYSSIIIKQLDYVNSLISVCICKINNCTQKAFLSLYTRQRSHPEISDTSHFQTGQMTDDKQTSVFHPSTHSSTLVMKLSVFFTRC